MLDNTPNQPLKVRTKNWFEINDERGMYNTNSQIKFKTQMPNTSNAYVLVSGTISVADT